MSFPKSTGLGRARQTINRASIVGLMGVSLALALEAGAQAQSFTGFYMFGDSMSDPGNLNAVDPRQFGTPNWKGRPSNGPTWADYMPGLLKISYNQYFNFAIAGATIGNSDDITSLLGPYQLGRVGAIPSTALVGLNGGGNGISGEDQLQNLGRSRGTGEVPNGLDTGDDVARGRHLLPRLDSSLYGFQDVLARQAAPLALVDLG